MANLSSKPVTLVYRPDTTVLGIDLGTTNIACALHKAGDTKSEVIPYNDGRRIMPSTVEFSALGTCISCGAQAQRKLKTSTGYVLYGKTPYIYNIE